MPILLRFLKLISNRQIEVRYKRSRW